MSKGNYKHRHTEVYKGIRIDKKANTLKELMLKVEQKKREIDSGLTDSNIPLQKYAFKWLETYKKPNVSQSWYEDIERRIKQIVDGIGNKPLGKITAIEIQSYLNTLTCYTDSHIKKTYDIINQVFTRAYKDGLIRPIDINCPRGRRLTVGRSLTDYEREILLEVLKGHRGEFFCKLMLYCGLRGGEVAALQWKDIDLESGIIHVNKAMKKDGTIGEPKTASGVRDVPIPYKFIAELKKAVKSPFSPVCVNTQGKPYTRTARTKMWNSVKREMNIKMGCKVFRNQLIPPLPLEEPFKIHYLRHTYCTDLEKAGVPINIAKVLMGHSSITVTAQIYTHADSGTLELARNLIDVANDVAKIK